MKRVRVVYSSTWKAGQGGRGVEKATEECCVYEQFTTVVHLTQQVCVIDIEWLEVLLHVRNGSCRSHHIDMLRSLIITNPQCPPHPTPCSPPPLEHGDGIRALSTDRIQIFLCRPFDTIGEWPVTLVEHFVISSNCSNRGSKQGEQGCLPNTTMLAVGMKVMVTHNIKTDPDIAKGARGEIVQVVLNDCETKISPSQSIVST